MGNLAHGRTAGNDGIVIAGGGLAAQRCAETLRRSGCEEPIRLLCAETHQPYDRPPLSKGLLAEGGGPAEVAFRRAAWYESSDVDLLCGVAASSLRPAEHLIHTSDGRSLRYSRLLIATGGRARTLGSLVGHGNVLTLRTVDDAIELRERLTPGVRLAIVGAGFVGLEIAATARKLGVEVTVIEAGPAPLAGVLGERIGGWFAELHLSQGVSVVLGRSIVRVEQHGGDARMLLLSDGTAIQTDQIVVGIGIDAETAWLTGSGLDDAEGVRVNEHGRTSVPDVFAAGDVAATFDPRRAIHVPGSHWEAAARQAAAAARLMLDLDPGERPVPSFWTDQYGLRIQYVGRAAADDEVELDGDPRSCSFTVTYTRGGRVTAVLLVDRPRSLPAARALIEEGTTCHTECRSTIARAPRTATAWRSRRRCSNSTTSRS